MDFMKYEGKGYQPVYTRTALTDALHEAFGFCTSKQIVPIAKMRNIIHSIDQKAFVTISEVADVFKSND